MRLTGLLLFPDTTKLLIILAVATSFGGSARAATFTSSLADAQWLVKASVFECSLSHPIATYGSAVFARRAGEAEIFRLHQKKQVLPAGNAELLAVAPRWNGDQTPVPMGGVEVIAGDEPIRLDATRAHQLQSVLEQGRRLIFLRHADPVGQAAVRVILEPIHFRAGIQAYRDCISHLLPVNFNQIERTAVYFPEAANSLSAAESRKLDVLIRYVKADKRVNKIYIDGHTDSEGVRPENLEVSKTRAELIAVYLTEHGIPEDNLVTRWHGERYPVASNKTPAARAQNRRVTLRLERGKT